MEMPSFLQSKQEPESKSGGFFRNKHSFSANKQSFSANKKNLSILSLVILLLAIPLTVWLAQRAQIFAPRADIKPIELVSGDDSCVVSTDPNKVSCASFPIKLTSPFGPPAELIEATPSATATASASISPTASASASIVPSPSAIPLPEGLVSYWNFNETSGNTAADLKGVSNGTATGTTIVDGKPGLGKARSYSASGDKVQTAATTLNLNNLTVSAWVLPTGVSGSGAEAIVNQNPNMQLMTLYNTNSSGQNDGQFHPHFNFGNRGAIVGNPALAINTWSHLAVTRDGATGVIKVYINGSEVSYFTTVPITAGQLTSQSQPIVIGLLPGYNFQFKGTLDEIGIWNRTLTPAEVASLYNGGQGVVIGDSGSLFKTKFYSAIYNRLASYLSISKAQAQTASPSATASAACSNLVKNFSFENPQVVSPNTNNGWLVYGGDPAKVVSTDFFTTTNIPDWDPRITNAPYQVELQRGLYGAAAQGSQYAEIDIPGMISLTQPLLTQAGQQYQVKFDYSSRPNMTAVQKMGVYWNGQQVGTVEGQTGRTALSWQEKTFTVTGIAGTSKLGFGALPESASRSGNLIDNVSVTQSSGLCSGGNGSPSPSPSPSGIGTAFYKMAETEAGLEDAELIPYDEHPLFTDFTFSDSLPGVKQIWVEFISALNTSRKEHISVELVEPDPVITSLDCSMDVSKQDLKLTLNGSRLGSSGGKVTANTKEAQILAWGETQVSATIKPDGGLDEGKLFKVIVTRKDGKALPEIACQVNTTLISLGARLFCREPGKFDVNGVAVVLVDENGNRVNETVTIDKDGIIKNLKTKLQVGKLYSVSVKAPHSLRRNGLFTAANGTNVISNNDATPFILPIGDIAPVILNDGKINTLDRSEIVRQWSVLGSSTKTGDFNRDTKINSIDWACMRYDFNKEDDQIPDKAALPSGSPVPTASPNPTTAASTSPLPSGQRAAYFLLEPFGGGSYPNGDEFIVNVNIWSQNEAANLFVAKFSFDPTALEVARIEKGGTLTSWAEEFFDNQSGQISLTAGLPSPGLKTTQGNDPLMAKIIFRGKKVGNTTLSVTQASKIYSNADNQNILTSLLSAQVAITN